MPTQTTTADPATETGISDRAPRFGGARSLTGGARGAFVIAGLAVALAACGGGGAGPATGTAGQPGSFSWLRPGPPPTGWQVVGISNGATIAYPPAWRRIRSDPGTASVAQLGPGDQFIAYLNLTPGQGHETVANWGRFRPDHNAEEGDRHVTTLTVGRSLHFRTGRGACVRDSYVTSSNHRYIELACIVAGSRATTVVVGAAPPGSWSRVSPLIERAISTMTT